MTGPRRKPTAEEPSTLPPVPTDGGQQWRDLQEFDNGENVRYESDEMAAASELANEGTKVPLSRSEVEEEYYDPTFYDKMNTLLQKTNMDISLSDRKDVENGRKSVEQNLLEIQEMIRNGQFSSSELVGFKDSESTKERELQMIEDARRQMDDEAYEKIGRSELINDISMIPNAASLQAIKEAEQMSFDMAGKDISSTSLPSISSIFDAKEEAYNRLVKALGEGPPIHEGPECPVCKGAATEEEMQVFGKCSFCRAEDLIEPDIHLAHRYSLMDYDGKYRETRGQLTAEDTASTRTENKAASQQKPKKASGKKRSSASELVEQESKNFEEEEREELIVHLVDKVDELDIRLNKVLKVFIILID